MLKTELLTNLEFHHLSGICKQKERRWMFKPSFKNKNNHNKNPFLTRAGRFLLLHNGVKNS